MNKVKVVFSLVFVFAIFGLTFLFSVPSKALESNFPVMDYGDYNAVVLITQVDLEEDDYNGYCYLIAEIYGSVLLVNDDYVDVVSDFTADSNVLLLDNDVEYASTSIESYELYYVTNTGSLDSLVFTHASKVYTYNNWYVNNQIYSYYNEAYSNALNATYSEAYNQGFIEGQRNSDLATESALYNQKIAYESIIANKDILITDLQEQLASEDFSFGSFKELLGAIILLPVRFFKEGLDVELFGVNVGSLIVSIGILSIVITIVFFIIGKTSRKSD